MTYMILYEMEKESSKLFQFLFYRFEYIFHLKTFLKRLKYILTRRIAILECDSCRNETRFLRVENDMISHTLYSKEKSLACFIERRIEQAPNWQRIQSVTCRTCAHVVKFLFVSLPICICTCRMHLQLWILSQRIPGFAVCGNQLSKKRNCTTLWE